MKRVCTRINRAALFALCALPVVVPVCYWCVVSYTHMLWWFFAQTLLAALVALLPAQVGNYRETVTLTHVGRSNDPNPDREVIKTVKKEGFRVPLRLVVFGLLLFADFLLLMFVPQAWFVERKTAFHLIIMLFLPVCFLLATQGCAASFCLWSSGPGIIFGAVMYLIAAIGLEYTEGEELLKNILHSASVIFLICGAVALNRQSLISGMSALGASCATPQTLLRRNRRMVLLFVGIILLLAFSEPLREGALWLFAQMWKGVKWFFGLFGGSEEEAATTLEEDLQRISNAMSSQQAAQAEEEAAIAEDPTAAYVFFALVGLAGVVIFFDKLRKLLKKLSDWMEKFAVSIGDSYYDEQENLEKPNEEDAQNGKRGLSRLKELFKREPSWETLSAREKVRRLMRDFYRKRLKGGGNFKALTAREAISKGNAGRAKPKEFADLYDLARYSTHDVQTEAAEKLKKDLRG